MKISILFTSCMLLSILTACNSEGLFEQSDKQKVLIKASGLTKPVVLGETKRGLSHTITQDGNIEMSISKGIYQFEIVDSAGQDCSLSPQLDLVCEDITCTTQYAPVCAKKPYVNVCITTPCETDVYQTFSNSCEANRQNAWLVFESECEDLEDVAALHTKPVRMVSLASFDYLTEPFKLVRSQIVDDTVTIDIEVSGGCGSHEISLFVDDLISNPGTNPPGIAFGIAHLNFDNCEGLVEVRSKFDLLPLRENYRRLFPDTSGVVRLSLNELGVYEFEL